MQRSITGLFFGIIVIGLIVLGEYTFGFLLLLISSFSLNEFLKLELGKANKKYRRFALLMGICIIAATITLQLLDETHPRNVYLLFFLILLPILDLFYNKKESYAGKVLMAYGLIPFSLIGLWFATFQTETLEYNYSIPLNLLLLTWANDVGAYLIGKFFGKRKLFERISPNKTKGGFYGGVILTIIALLTMHSTGNLDYLNLPNNNMYFVLLVILGFAISVCATFGDLYQSYIKRIHGVKDSGKMLPGHGGFWDRFDGFFFVIYGYLIFVNLFL